MEEKKEAHEIQSNTGSHNINRMSDMTNKDFVKGLENHVNSFSIDSIIDELPEMLKAPCNILVDEIEKEVFLIGALGVASGLIPNVKGVYSGKVIAANIYAFVLGGYGGGKGGLEYARMLGAQIHQAKRDKSKELMARYLLDMEVYKKELKEFNKSKDKQAPPHKPEKPPSKMLFIPSNNSKSGIYQLLQENDTKGIIFETEGDTMADAIKQDYGNFSDILRKAFHHEYLDMFRRLNNEMIEIKNPELSVVLSSTLNQLKLLIPSIENGLYSRFLFYELKQNKSFANVFDNRKNDYQEKFIKAGNQFTDLYYKLEGLSGPIWFTLSENQQQKFVELFSQSKAKLIEDVDVSMAGTANRLGVIAFRIMMIFTTLRAHQREQLKDTITCSDIDFNNAIKLVERFKKHANTVFEYLNRKPTKKELAVKMRKDGVSIPKISRSLDINKGTISKWCKEIKTNESSNPGNPQ